MILNYDTVTVASYSYAVHTLTPVQFLLDSCSAAVELVLVGVYISLHVQTTSSRVSNYDCNNILRSCDWILSLPRAALPVIYYLQIVNSACILMLYLKVRVFVIRFLSALAHWQESRLETILRYCPSHTVWAVHASQRTETRSSSRGCTTCYFEVT